MNFLKVLCFFQAFTHYTSGKQAYFYTSQSGDVWQQDKPDFRSLHRCSLKGDCSDIAKDNKTGKFMQIKGQEEKDKALKDGKMIWTKIPLIESYPIQKKNGGLVEVGAKDDKFAEVTVDVPRGKYKIKLIYHSGYLSCHGIYRTKFGCVYPPHSADIIWIVITDRHNNILLPKHNGKGYTHDGRFSNSQFVIFNDIIELHPGQQLHLWYKEDLDNSNNYERDNSGTAKFYVTVILQQ